MHKDYEKIKEEYLRISSETRNKLTAISLAVIGAIYFFSKDGKDIINYSGANILLLKLALLSYIFTIACEIIAGFLKSQHYALWFDGEIESIDYRKSTYGKVADLFFWIPPITFVVGTVLFFIALFS